MFFSFNGGWAKTRSGVRALTLLCTHRSVENATAETRQTRMPGPCRRRLRPSRGAPYISAMIQDPKGNTEPKSPQVEKPKDPVPPAARRREIGGPKGPEPTRYGDWEIGGRCIDF
jgi:Protein of unknown function (DUF1674)